MLAAQRHSLILEALEREGVVRVSELTDQLGVSDMTIRRDLTSLHREGKLEKIHGGARSRPEPSTSEPGFERKSQQRLAQKEAIAAVAAAMIEPGSSVAISAGTTTHALAYQLAQIPRLTVITNSVWVADVLNREGEALTVLLTGGQRTPSDALVGPLAVAALRSLHVDTCFLGVHGMHSETGFTTPNLLESETNRAMIAAANRLVVVADSTKWGILGLSSMARLDEADVLVTDADVDPHALASLRREIGSVQLATPPHTRVE